MAAVDGRLSGFGAKRRVPAPGSVATASRPRGTDVLGKENAY
jgi:hypothetical protein